MSDNGPLVKDNSRQPEEANEMERVIRAKGRRKLQAREQGKRSPWFGLGMLGLIGWSVALPTVAGAFVGSWIDSRWPNESFSWKLALLFAGLFIGCGNAWYWIQKEIQK